MLTNFDNYLKNSVSKQYRIVDYSLEKQVTILFEKKGIFYEYFFMIDEKSQMVRVVFYDIESILEFDRIFQTDMFKSLFSQYYNALCGFDFLYAFCFGDSFDRNINSIEDIFSLSLYTSCLDCFYSLNNYLYNFKISKYNRIHLENKKLHTFSIATNIQINLKTNEFNPLTVYRFNVNDINIVESLSFESFKFKFLENYAANKLNKKINNLFISDNALLRIINSY
jgi:hypothetical protein